MNDIKKYILILFISLIIPNISLAASKSAEVSLPERVLSFYGDVGNFYLDSISGSLNSVKYVLSDSANFYKPLPSQVAMIYIKIGEVMIGTSENSLNGLASIGNGVLKGVEYNTAPLADAGNAWVVITDFFSHFYSK